MARRIEREATGPVTSNRSQQEVRGTITVAVVWAATRATGADRASRSSFGGGYLGASSPETPGCRVVVSRTRSRTKCRTDSNSKERLVLIVSVLVLAILASETTI